MDTNASIKPNWEGLNLSEFEFKFGDEVQFEWDNHKRNGVVVDFSKDEAGRWIGISFLEENKIFGRQIPSGFSGDCVELLDVCYLHESGVTDLVKVGSYKIDVQKIGMGALMPAMTIQELEQYFKQGLEQRAKKQMDCAQISLEPNPVHECYFEISQFF